MALRLCVAALGVLLSVLDSPALAQRAGVSALAAATGLACEFRVVATGTWKGEAAQADVKNTVLRMGFVSINADEGTAESAGSFGRTDIIAKLSSDTLHMIQSFKEGPVYMTTVFNKETRPGKLRAVHTRHEYTDVTIPGYTSSPEQYYGECELQR